MKITCADCRAVYNISDDRIPEQGIDTVCKKCGKSLHIGKDRQHSENRGEDILTETRLTECRECGKEISFQAKTCPHCGVRVKPGIFDKVKKQVGEIGESAKEKAGSLGEISKDAVKHMDKEQLKELAKRTSEITSRHSGKIDRLLRFSFRFGKLVSAFFIFIFFLLFISGIAYYFIAGNAGFRQPRFEDVRPMLEEDGKSYSSHDFSEIDRKRKVENTYGDSIKKRIVAYGFSEGTYDVMLKWMMNVPEKFQEQFMDGMEDFLKDTEKWAKKNNEKHLQYHEAANTYQEMFFSALGEMKEKNQEISERKMAILGSIAASLLLFIIFLIIPILIKIEENSANTVSALENLTLSRSAE